MRICNIVSLIALHASGALFCSAVQAAEPTKPIQECEQEYQARKASLHSAGISASSFFHECWWHSRQGYPTELPSDEVRDRTNRLQSESVAKRLWTEKKSAAESPTEDHLSGRFSDRREKRREARLQRRTHRIIAARARRPLLATRAPYHNGKRSSVAELRVKPGSLRNSEERLAALSRRNAERRERYALRRSYSKQAHRAEIEASIEIPANAIDGRRSWIGTDTGTGPRKVPAVMIGELQSAAVKGTLLHCWDQNVLYLTGKARWQQSLVCDNKIEPSAQKIWFEQYTR